MNASGVIKITVTHPTPAVVVTIMDEIKKLIEEYAEEEELIEEITITEENG